MCMCAQRRLRSIWAYAQSDQSLRCLHENALVLCPANTLIRLCGCSDRSAYPLRSVCVSTGRTCKFVGNHVSRIKCEPAHDKTYKMACAPSEDSDQPGHPPSLIRVFAVRIKKAWILSYLLSAQRRLWSDWADAQAHILKIDLASAPLNCVKKKKKKEKKEKKAGSESDYSLDLANTPHRPDVVAPFKWLL